MQNINKARYGITPRLKEHWRIFRKLWKSFSELAKAVTDISGLIAIEWPIRCAYWQDGRVKRVVKTAQFSHAVVAACMYGMRPQCAHEPDQYIGKCWRISANSAEFAAALDRRCDGSHRHVVTVGRETAATAFYPRQLALQVHFALQRWAKTPPSSSSTS